MAIRIHSNDEQPVWVATVSVNGAAPDYSTNYTFTCYVLSSAGATLMTKTTGITGAAAGVITTTFTGAELVTGTVTGTYATPGFYRLQLVPRRTSDSADGPTIEEDLVVRYRPA